MAKGTKEYIEALNSFTYALDQLVQTLTEKEKVSGSGGSDVLEEFFTSSSSQFEMVEAIAEDVKSIKEDIVKSNSKQNEILKTVKAIKTKKDKGIFDKLGEEDDKDSIVEGVKTIVLMAGAVLAIGLAFSIIGKVDFVSVIALSIALPLIAHAFATIADIGGLDYNSAMSMGLILVIIATAMVVSSHILSMMSKIKPEILVSAIAVGLILTVVAVGASLLLESLDGSSIKDVFMVGLIMVVISAAIVLSSYILQYTVPIPFWDIVTASIAIGIVSVVMAVTLWVVNKLLNLKDAIQGSLMLVVISTAIMISSHILGLGNYDNFPSVDWSLGVGLSVLLLAPAILLLGIPAFIPMILIGSLMLVVVSTAIMTASHILNEGNYDNYPSVGWAAGVGLVMGIFGPLTLMMGGIGLFLPIVLIGIELLKKVAYTIVDLSSILSGGTYEDGPSKEWAEGIGLSLVYFMQALNAVGGDIWSWWGVGDSTEEKIAKLKNTVSAMVGIAEYLGNVSGAGVFDANKAPSKEWAAGVGGSIVMFMQALNIANDKSMWESISSFFGGGQTMEEKMQVLYGVVDAMVNIAAYLNEKSASFKNGPSKEWADGVGGSIVLFSESIVSLADTDSDDIIDGVEKLKGIANVMVQVGEIFTLNSKAFTKGPSKKWADGVGGSIKMFSGIISDLKDIGIVDFMGSIKKIQVIAAVMINIGRKFTKEGKIFSGGIFEKATKGINTLANAFMNFSKSIRSMGEATKDIGADSIDMIRNISLSVMALSAVDANNLENVLGKLKPEDIAKLYELSAEAAGTSSTRQASSDANKRAVSTGVTKSTSSVEVRRQTKELINIKKELQKMNSSVSRIALTTEEILEIKTTNNSGTSISN